MSAGERRVTIAGDIGLIGTQGQEDRFHSRKAYRVYGFRYQAYVPERVRQLTDGIESGGKPARYSLSGVDRVPAKYARRFRSSRIRRMASRRRSSVQPEVCGDACIGRRLRGVVG